MLLPPTYCMYMYMVLVASSGIPHTFKFHRMKDFIHWVQVPKGLSYLDFGMVKWNFCALNWCHWCAQLCVRSTLFVSICEYNSVEIVLSTFCMHLRLLYCVCLSVSALAASVSVNTCNQRYSRNFDLLILEKCCESVNMLTGALKCKTLGVS